MAWLQQVLLAVLFSQPSLGAAQTDVCTDVAHTPDADVAYQPDTGSTGADLNSGPALDVSQVQVPVTIDVLRKRGHRPRAMGETLVGVAKTDGGNVVLYGPAINGGEPVALGPDCRPLEPVVGKPERK